MINNNFYIDVAQSSYRNTFWRLQSYPVTAVEYTFKWKYIGSTYDIL